MVLVALIGQIGEGKTLGLTFLGWHNAMKGKTIFSNYHLKGFPYTLIKTVDDFLNMEHGIALLDELWLWADCREHKAARNKIINAMLAKSRKKDLEIIWTAQSFRQVDLRVRMNTFFIIIPNLSKNEKRCTLRWFHYTDVYGRPVKNIRFSTESIFKMYDTNEEIHMLEGLNVKRS